MAPIGKPKRRIKVEPLPKEAPKPIRVPAIPAPQRREKAPA